MSTVFMLSGQGSQYYKMGEDFYQSNSIFHNNLYALDKIVQDTTGRSVIEQIYYSEKTLSDRFDDIENSGLAILIIELAMVKTLADYSIYPDIFLGTSLGTIVATAASGCVLEEELVELVFKHGQIFRSECGEGRILSALESDTIYFDNSELQELSDLAGTNYSKGCVLSMPEENLNSVQNILTKNQVSTQILPIQRAYHSRWIENSQASFIKLYNTVSCSPPRSPIVCASTQNALQEIDGEVMWNSIRAPMQFIDTIMALELSGPHNYIDVGPTGTLATFTKYNLPNDSYSSIYPVLSPFRTSVKSFDNLLKLSRQNHPSF